MIPVTTFKGKTVALFGLGGSGLATALALAAGGAEVIAWDDTPRCPRRQLHSPATSTIIFERP